MPPCPGCGTEMRPSFTGDALVYYVCGACGMSKMDVKPANQPLMANDTPKQTGLVCVQCNKPYAVIERDGPHQFELHCRRCGHHWTVPTSDRKQTPDVH